MPERPRRPAEGGPAGLQELHPARRRQSPAWSRSPKISIVDLAFELYEDGDEDAVGEIESRLGHEDKVVRYYAAYKLSLVSDKKAAAKAAPVLKRIVETETDPELLDRARIALLRVSPESLRAVEDRKPRSGSRRDAQDPHPGVGPERARLLA